MKTTFFNKTTLATVVVLTVLSLIPQINANAPLEEPQQREPSPQSAYDHSAIGVVLRANSNEVPASGEELIRVLKQVGEFAQLPVSFSSVSMSSGLTSPRVIIAPKTGGELQAEPEEVKGAKSSSSRMSHSKAQPTTQPRQLNNAAVDRPNLEGRLFFAANMEKANDSRIRVKTVEFISWNSRKKGFDFGVIDYSSDAPEIKLLDGVRCMSCHKNKGPILGSGPWSNTTNNQIVRKATLIALNLHNQTSIAASWNSLKTDALGEDMKPILDLKAQTTFDGMSLVLPEPEAVDAAVRIGSDLVRDRAIYRAMLKSADGRKAFAFLLSAVVDSQPIDKSFQQVKHSMDLAFVNSFTAFGNDVVAIHNTSSSILRDYSPAASMGSLKSANGKPAAWGKRSMLPANTTLSWSGTTEKVMDYDSRRTNSNSAMVSARQPSSTKAFVPAMADFPALPSKAVSAAGLARAIGLTETDRSFLFQLLQGVAQRINKAKVTEATLAQEVFSGPSFADNWKTGDIPDRGEFKDRFVAGLSAVANDYQLYDGIKADRRDYASGPYLMTTPGKEDRETEIVPTTACLRCHDVRGVGKPTFNPIPLLAFDPFDKKSRDVWVSNANSSQKLSILSLMLKRLATERDMPPDDSLEHDLFRSKDPDSFDSVRDFLESELKKLQ